MISVIQKKIRCIFRIDEIRTGCYVNKYMKIEIYGSKFVHKNIDATQQISILRDKKIFIGYIWSLIPEG